MNYLAAAKSTIFNLKSRISLMTLETKVQLLPRIQKPHVAALKKLGIETVQDLLLYFPFRYLDFSKTGEIKNIRPNEAITITATVKNITSRHSFKSHLSLAKAVVSDATGSLRVVWFNQPYLAKSLKAGDELFLSGTPEYFGKGLQLTNPLFEKVSDFPLHTARLVPVYHMTEGLYPKTLRNLIGSVLPLAMDLMDILPEDLRKRQQLLSITDTVNASHFPEKLDDVDQAKKRLAFEEIFINQLLAQKHKRELAAKQSHQITFNQNLVKSFVDSLPFQLTAGQRQAAWDILQDIEKPVPMNRLIEGDVGSGKTLVAFIAALECAREQFQIAFLAPTEILAKQHYQTAQKFITKESLKGAKLALLTSKECKLDGEKITKPKLQGLIEEGMPGIYFGTHALIADKVKFSKLCLVVIDEQHRLGVEQRATLVRGSGKVPHLLSLTATPIPRTLQLAYYGELSISQIKSKPQGRKSIITHLIEPSQRGEAYTFIKEQIKQGRQVFVITPLIEESETLQVKSAKAEYEALQKIFTGLAVGLLHGKMKSVDKDKAMADFLAGKIHVLVSTSVVEVGVDVPNASVMLIEGSERFGLAQLHQFRGRVGRADHQSYCFLFMSESAGVNNEEQFLETKTRLEDFTKTGDGFALAELDLKHRGFGDLYGSKQSGWNFKYFSSAYVSLIPPARQEAIVMLDNDPKLSSHPLLKDSLEGKVIHFE